MATEFEIQCALMAGRVYLSTRNKVNWFPVADGWGEFFHAPSETYPITEGFEALSFQNESDPNNIVIAYAGTNGPGDLADNFNNLELATGQTANLIVGVPDQLLQAAEYYLAVKAENLSATVTFTGHSLGGGLAALMGVFFGRQAITFDQAPFANSAEDSLLTRDYAENLRDYLAGKSALTGNQAIARDELIADLTGFLILREAQGGIPRSNLVSTIRVDGEFLGALPFDAIGTATTLDHGDYFGPIDLHSQALLAAFVQNDDFRKVTFSLTDLLPMIFDENLFEHDTDPESDKVNLLEHLLRHEVGGVDGVAADGDNMLACFTADLQKLAAADGLSIPGSDLTKALIAFAMQAYYEGRIATDISQQLFEAIGGGLHFERSDISTDPDLNKIKGYVQYFKNYLATLPAAEQALINQQLPDLLDWYLAGTHLAATAGDQTAFMLGASKTDSLTGGSQADLLVGLDGNDILDGGAGSDVINGGAGDDFIFGGGNVTVGLSEQSGPYSYNRFADGEVVMLSKDAAGQLILPGNLSGVSGTDSHVSEALAYHVEGDGADAIDGGDGDDWVLAGEGADVVEGGAGKDTLFTNFMKVGPGGTAGNDGEWRAAA